MALQVQSNAIFGVNVTFRWQGKGGNVRVVWQTRWPNGDTNAPTIDKTITLADSLVGYTSKSFDTGSTAFNAISFVNALFDARLIVTNISIPGAPSTIFDSGWLPGVYQLFATVADYSVTFTPY